MIYLDNAATTFPKPACVADAVYQYIYSDGMNVSRSSYSSAYKTEEMVYETRSLLSGLFHGPDCRNVVFTKNITESLNIILKGFLKAGDHILVSSLEHNAVMRPLVQLEAQGITFDRIPCTGEGDLNLESIELLIKPNTKAILLTHASNVCGTVLPIRKVGEICEKHQIRFIVDSAQTAGILNIDMQKCHIDALAFTGHKSLLGPQGIGGFILNPELAKEITPVLSGGTGSMSHTELIPEYMPDKFEPGTLNLPGIAGLNASLKWIRDMGMESILSHEQNLTDRFLKGLLSLEQEGLLEIVGHKNMNDRIGVVSITTSRMDLSELAQILDESYSIATRVGLHCAPSAHKTLGTYPIGTIRFSFGWNTQETEVETCLTAIQTILQEGE